MSMPEQGIEPRFPSPKPAYNAPVTQFTRLTGKPILKTCVLPLKENRFYRQNTWAGEKWRSYLQKFTVAQTSFTSFS